MNISNNLLKKYDLFFGDRRFPLLTNNMESLEEQVVFLHTLYNSLTTKYQYKLDRESVFLLMFFEILDKQNRINFIEQQSLLLLTVLYNDLELALGKKIES